jgi:multidrug efflux pump
MRRTLGTAVFSGMVGVTLFGIVLTPVFFYTIDWLGGSRLFNARATRIASTVGLVVLTGGIPWILVFVLSSWKRRTAVPVKIPIAEPQENGASKTSDQEAYQQPVGKE